MSVARARRLRQQANLPERLAWEALRTLRRHGFAVRRQHPIGQDIVDFAFLKARLVVEVDGGIHKLEGVQVRDRERDFRLQKAGWRVLRVPAKVALSDDVLLEQVLSALRSSSF
mgnify:CR=1 FL=1